MEQKTQRPLEEFTTVIKDLTILAKQITDLEDAKALAASERRHQLLDGYIQREQACILKLRGLEQHRIRLAEALGWNSLTFRQILEKMPPQESKSIEPLFLDLESQLNRMQQARKAAEQIMKVRIHEINVAIAQKEGGSYDTEGNVNVNPPRAAKLKNTYI